MIKSNTTSSRRKSARRRGRIVRHIAAMLILVFSSAGCSLLKPKPQPRPPGAEGSAQWAYTVALARAKSVLANDAVLVEITGKGVMSDGRLAANLGEWALSFSSFTARSRVTITVDHTRALADGEQAAPGVIHAIGSPPGNFWDSINIFNATIGHGAAGDRKVRDPVACQYDQIAGAHVWVIKFTVGAVKETHEVRWDGIHLGVKAG